MPFHEVPDKKAALLWRSTGKTETRGVWLINRKFNRGFDLKLGVDAAVLIVDHDESLSWTELNQAIGRGNRA